MVWSTVTCIISGQPRKCNPSENHVALVGFRSTLNPSYGLTRMNGLSIGLGFTANIYFNAIVTLLQISFWRGVWRWRTCAYGPLSIMPLCGVAEGRSYCTGASVWIVSHIFVDAPKEHSWPQLCSCKAF